MKIAIPTDDGLIVRQQFKSSKAFLVSTIKEGRILEQDLRWNFLSEILTSKHGYFFNLVDCDLVIVNEIGPGHTELLAAREVKIVKTKESLISQALYHYLENTSEYGETVPTSPQHLLAAKI